VKLIEELMDACQQAVEAIAKLSMSGDYAEAVETTHCIIFNTRLVGMLMRIQHRESKTFGELRKEEPRRFHELLGSYIGDIKEKNRLYRLPQLPQYESDAYDIQGLVLTPGLPFERFRERRRHLKAVFDLFGGGLCERADMRYVEATIKKFADSHPYAFPGMRFSEVIRLKQGGTVKADLEDHVVVGNGYVVDRIARSAVVPRMKSRYVGPFLYVSLRGKLERKDKHFQMIRKALSCLI
jgi:hypothetical protein